MYYEHDWMIHPGRIMPRTMNTHVQVSEGQLFWSLFVVRVFDHFSSVCVYLYWRHSASLRRICMRFLLPRYE